jgi:mRNA-degrading endonuclease toxin of MazEF toxin-antitoxin module
MPSTTTYKRGQVIVVNVPFSNHTGIKPRPALVISTDAFHRDLPDLVVCPIISSQPRYHRKPGGRGLSASEVAGCWASACEHGQDF